MKHHKDNIIHEAKGALAIKLSISEFIKSLPDKPHHIIVNPKIENRTYKVKFTITKNQSPSGYAINHIIIDPEGKSEFTLTEAQAIKEHLKELRSVDSDAQEKIRANLRKHFGFYISDYTDSKNGFTESDFDDLVEQFIITLI